MAKRQEDSATTLLGLKTAKCEVVGVMTKSKTLRGVYYGLGISMFTSEGCSWGLYHLEALASQFDRKFHVP